MIKDTEEIIDIISNEDIGTEDIVTNNAQLDWTVIDVYFPNIKHELLESKSIDLENGKCGWYMLDKGTDVKLKNRDAIKIYSGYFADGYEIDLYKVN